MKSLERIVIQSDFYEMQGLEVPEHVGHSIHLQKVLMDAIPVDTTGLTGGKFFTLTYSFLGLVINYY
jgi:hypothetical protein